MPGDLTGSFKTHSGYLHALSYLCGYRLFVSEAAVGSALATRIKGDPKYHATSARVGFDGLQIKRSLNAAWGSELLLVISGTYAPDELKGVSNSWVAIQSYYACYHAIQALVVARGSVRPSSHPVTQRRFIDAWVTSPSTLTPWSLAALDGGYANLPPGHVVDESAHAWTTLDEKLAIDVACKSFRTTREDAVVAAKQKARTKKQRDKRRSWEADETARQSAGKRPRVKPTFPLSRLTPAEHRSVEAGTRPFGMLDYLYRLRIKAQYEDSTLFVEGPEDQAESVAVFRHLTRIVRSTLMLHELFIERIVGRAAFEPLVDEWLTRQSAAPVNPLAERRSLILP